MPRGERLGGNFNRITRRAFLGGMTAGACAAGIGLNDWERQIFVRINELRVKSGAGELEWDDALAAAARRESGDMAREGFFSHINPARGDLAARLCAERIRWWRCAENIMRENGYDDVASCAVVRWWYSEGHKRNLLNAWYTRTGVGLATGANGDVFATQVFVTPPPRGMRARVCGG